MITDRLHLVSFPGPQLHEERKGRKAGWEPETEARLYPLLQYQQFQVLVSGVLHKVKSAVFLFHKLTVYAMLNAM